VINNAKPENPVLVLLLFSALAALSGCCSTPPPQPDFSTPLATLETFQDAFRADAGQLEYECFAHSFKESMGGFDLDSYAVMRDEAIDANPLVKTFLALKDLAGSVKSVQVDPNNRQAIMNLNVLGTEFDILFLRETIYHLEFDNDSRVREDFMPPLRSTVAANQGALLLIVPDVNPRWLKKVEALRKLSVEERWKFGDFDFIQRPNATAPQL